MTTIIQIFDRQYPIGWEWLYYVPLEDWQWLIDVFATMTDNTETYDYASYITSEGFLSNEREEVFYYEGKIASRELNRVNLVDTQGLAKFLNDDQGYQGGIREFGYYIAAKALNIKSEKEYLENFNKIQELNNRPLR